MPTRKPQRLRVSEQAVVVESNHATTSLALCVSSVQDACLFLHRPPSKGLGGMVSAQLVGGAKQQATKY